MKSYFKRRGWRDLIFLLVVVSLGIWVERRFYGLGLSDTEKWSRRAQIDPRHTVGAPAAPGVSGQSPCFFIVPSTAVGQPVQSETVGDCLLLTPDGKNLDLFEVALAGGFVHIKSDLFVPGVVPIALTRTTLPLNDRARRNQVYLPHVYDPFLSGDRFPYTYLDWILPDGQPVHFKRISSGTGFADAVYESTAKDHLFAGSRINWNGFGWDLALANGATYLSPEAYNATRSQQGSLVGIFDEKGNQVKLRRAANGDLMEIQSPQGGWIRLRYDEKERVTRADASSGGFVQYRYDTENQLTQVKYSSGETIEYSYDGWYRIIGVNDSAKSLSLKMVYDHHGTAIALATDSGHRYEFDHRVDRQAGVVQVEITDPQGQRIRVRIQAIQDILRYSVESPSPRPKNWGMRHLAPEDKVKSKNRTPT